MVNAELDEMKLAAEAWEVMETKIRALTTTQLHEWTDMGSVCRGQDCCDHVLSVGHVDGTLVGKIKGTKPYVTNVGLDESGEMTGFCTCPIGVRCKHAVALLLVAQQKLAAGEVINSVSNPAEWTVSPESVRERLELRGIRKSPPPPPPPPSLPRVRRIEVNENPFGLWTPLEAGVESHSPFGRLTEFVFGISWWRPSCSCLPKDHWIRRCVEFLGGVRRLMRSCRTPSSSLVPVGNGAVTDLVTSHVK